MLLILSGSSFVLLMNPRVTFGVILGGLVIIANFSVFQHTIRSAFSPDGEMKATKKTIIVKYYLRLLALGVVIYILIGNGWADPIGLAIGLSTVVIAIVSYGVKRAWQTLTFEAT